MTTPCQPCICELPTKLFMRHEDIIKKSESFFDVSYIEMQDCMRIREWVEPRQMTMAAIKQITGMSLKNIGYLFGGRDHSTVIHAIRTVKNLSDTDNAYRNKWERYIKYLSI